MNNLNLKRILWSYIQGICDALDQNQIVIGAMIASSLKDLENFKEIPLVSNSNKIEIGVIDNISIFLNCDLNFYDMSVEIGNRIFDLSKISEAKDLI